MSPRSILSLFTLGLLALVVFFSRHEIVHAWQLIEKVNLFVLALLIPIQLIVYFAAGEMMFSYLRAKGNLKKINPFTLTRMALELNFVNHLLPSGGVSGISYMTWRLGKYDVAPGRATMSQIVRYVAGFMAYLTLLVLSVVFITIDTGVNRFIILFSSVVASSIVFIIVFGTYVISSRTRLDSFASWLTHAINFSVRRVTFGRKRQVVKRGVIEFFFSELHNDYLALKKDGRILVKPYLWGLLFNAAEVSLFIVGFWALGFGVSPVAIVVAYGIASFAGFIVITPGGAGAYEALMISFISSAGTPGGVAIAGVLLTRVVLLAGTIASGYIFYQLTLLKYGKRTPRS